MYLIDKDYFTGKYEITNVIESHSGDADLLEQFIDTEIPVFMEYLLGSEFADFNSHMNNGVLKPDAPQKWLDLVNGVEYDGKKWNGLIYIIGGHKKSLFTNMIWTMFFNEKNRIDGNGNYNIIDSKNATTGNAANQYYPIWNEFVNLVGSVTYDEYYYPYYGYYQDYFVTLNQFISDNREDYPTARYVYAEYENRFL